MTDTISIKDMPIKFFTRDIINGRAKAVGDIFTALFLEQVCKFRVIELHSGCFFATMI